MGAVTVLVCVSGCWVQFVTAMRRPDRARDVGGVGNGGVGGVGGIAVCVGQAALNGELQQLIFTQITIERIIIEGQTGSRRSGARDPGSCHDGTQQK